MMSGHGANLIFFDKKIKIGRPEHSLIPTLLKDAYKIRYKNFISDKKKSHKITIVRPNIFYIIHET